jgi:hypothetical protein
MPTKDYSNYLPKINYNIIKKVELGIIINLGIMLK